MVKNKVSVVYLMGGFGNQLFQLCFAKSLKTKGHKVFIDMSNYKLGDKNSEILLREPILPISNFGFKKVNFILKYIIRYSNIFKNNKFRNYNFFPVKKYTDKNGLNKNDALINYYVGYWQDLNTITENKNFLKESLSNNEIINLGLVTKPPKGSTLLHVRRNDYVHMKEDLKLSYFKNAIDYIREKVGSFYFDVFTDDIEWVNSNKIFSEAKNIFFSSNSKEDTIETFAEMLKYENYIISNSTFSLIAASIKEDSNSIIIAPQPWFRNSDKEVNLKKEWVKLDNNE